MRWRAWLGALGVLWLLGGCRRGPEVVYLTRFEGISAAQERMVQRLIGQFYGRPVRLLPPQRHSPATWCPQRRRYRASAVLKQLQALLPPGTNGKILALAARDVEVEEPPQQPHWGVMGLANAVGGDACVVSTFRLAGRRDRLRKVSLHEIGHLMSLPHCRSGAVRCLMNDAHGRGATVDQTREELCPDCRARLAW